MSDDSYWRLYLCDSVSDDADNHDEDEEDERVDSLVILWQKLSTDKKVSSDKRYLVIKIILWQNYLITKFFLW